jgi:VWFA-related protein
MTRDIALLALGVVLVVLPAVADDPQSAQPQAGAVVFGDKVEVTVINVDVYVRDRKGRPVRGLTADDFQISQDGITMPISNFTVFSSEATEYVPPTEEGAAPAPVSAVAHAPDLRPVYMLFFIDNVNLQPLYRNRVLKRVREFVDRNLAPPVRMMVVSSGPSLEVRQPFTDDPQAVLAAFEAMADESGGRLVRDRERRQIFDWMEESSSDVRLDVLEFYNSGDQQVNRVRIQAQILAYVEEESHLLQNTLHRMREALRLLSGLDGRRSIVYVSSGLPLNPGLGMVYEFAAVFRDNSILTRVPQRSFQNQFHSLTAAANVEGVSFYTIDAGGLNPLEGFGAEDRFAPESRASAADMNDLQDSLSYMADATGGLAVLNTNDVAKGLELIRDDLFSYYSLGYTVSSSPGDRVYRIRVDLAGYPDHDLRYRRWAVEKSPDTRVRELVANSLLRGVESNPMELRLDAGEATVAPDRRWEVPIGVSIPLDRLALALEAGEYVGRVQLVLGARDAHGRESVLERREHVIRVAAASFDAAGAQRYRIAIPVLVREERHTLAVGVMDLTTRQSSCAVLEVAVP